jgi:hypothetical protein
MARLTKTERAVYAARVTAARSANYARDLARAVERSAVQLAEMTAAHEAMSARAERARVVADREAAVLVDLTTVKED